MSTSSRHVVPVPPGRAKAEGYKLTDRARQLVTASPLRPWHAAETGPMPFVALGRATDACTPG